jgi:hypothetical protein
MLSHEITQQIYTRFLSDRQGQAALAEPSVPMRIEPAAYGGKPVYFELIGPWTRTSRMQSYQSTTGKRTFLVIFVGLFPSVLVGSAILAWRNPRQSKVRVWKLLGWQNLASLCVLDGTDAVAHGIPQRGGADGRQTVEHDANPALAYVEL